ncbi:SDR family NAD(P)-dependent oxidoreductase [Cytobacillus oceanisediminis]|uniref:SDR family NAD(P)-dependent oxidoreductase n=1 Tax=Cytobacillus oceanisediminis TaxID=665099 RepID=UPI00203D40F6|nr:SDR family NAD(P)-dependent oxidoreductase [Cytobacillus oceanisediminis]MCM3391529.1 SDR family oxidoreductase [Cytobacillus oceanisediminis]
MFNQENQVAVVTGASRGIGKEISRRLASEGAYVYLVDINEEALADTRHELLEKGFAAEMLKADITNEQEVERFFSYIEERHGRADILVNNAGIIRDNLLFKMNADDWDSVMNVHLKGTFLCSKYAQKLMVQNKYGRIINLSSVSALGSRGQANYAAAKAGIQGFTKTLAIELGKYNITVNAIAPGFIKTEMTKAVAERLGISFQELIESKVKQIPVNRAGTPEDIAQAASFFASPASSFISGQVLYVAGGPKA